MEPSQPCSEPALRWFGVALGTQACSQLVISSSDPPKVTWQGMRVFGLPCCRPSLVSLCPRPCTPRPCPTPQNLLKNSLKVAGGGWLAAAAHTLWNAGENVQKQDISYATAAGQAVMAGLCLWRGFEDTEEKEVKVKV